MAEATLLEEIKASLATHARSATFACGGSIPLLASSKTSNASSSFGPFQIRYGNSGSGITLVVPDSNASSQEFQELLKISQPATFARAGEEVLDEDYRKAGKLDRGHFATDFCPYTTGIVDTLTQILLPQTKQSTHDRSIKAELYKLNVYSAPSGKFKPHVDTPRSEAQLGSLVVSLPFEHEGGQLAVRNAGAEVLFDWSESANQADTQPGIKWAAFYSDCEHEVLQVTSGNRVTLTYNLFVTRGLGHLAGSPSSVLEAKSLPLYKTLQTALKEPTFFRKGRLLAVWLTHSYAHTSKRNNFLPESLKGADMSLYETALALGLQCKLVPIIPDGGYAYGGKVDVFSQKFGALLSGEIYDNGCSEEWGQMLPDSNMTWVNPMKKELREAQTAYVVFGNDLGSLDVKYSHAAMLIRIPRFRNRGLPVDPSKNFWQREDMPDPEDYASGPDDWDSEGEENDDHDEESSDDDFESEDGEEKDEGPDAPALKNE